LCIRHRLHRLRPSLGTAFRLAGALTTASFPLAATTFAIAPTVLSVALAVTAAALAVTATAFETDSYTNVALATTVSNLWPPTERRVPKSKIFDHTGLDCVRLVVGRCDGPR
jgi:hypothetical protein